MHGTLTSWKDGVSKRTVVRALTSPTVRRKIRILYPKLRNELMNVSAFCGGSRFDDHDRVRRSEGWAQRIQRSRAGSC